ncbi:hypothetical protein FBZ82_104226 [Azospirillum brasilense]|uniref:Uncharacterized protein n=1 Tax=Azospirillum brasilense TaxID=192 RepID=A0A560BBV6_AZOBR|nr:hypothetical protein FBZ82_104226 [Azospirillum brasilense]
MDSHSLSGRLFDLGLTARSIRDHANDIVQLPARNLDPELHALGREAVGLGRGRWESAKPRPDPGLVGEGAGDGQGCKADDRLTLSGMETRRCGAAVGTHQPARTEKNATEPAADHQRHPIQLLAVYGLKNRAPRRSPRFAVIAGPVEVADPEGPAVVARIPLAARGDKSTCLLFGRDRPRRGQKAALLDLLLEMLFPFQCEHCLLPRSFLHGPEAALAKDGWSLFIP